MANIHNNNTIAGSDVYVPIVLHSIVPNRYLTHAMIVCVGGRGTYSFVACLSHLTIDHASLSRRSIFYTSDRDTANISELITFFPFVT